MTDPEIAELQARIASLEAQLEGLREHIVLFWKPKDETASPQ